MDKALVLAAGRGLRMQRPVDGVNLTSSQAATAKTGLKAMMPVGRPFIDYVLSGLADAGYRRVCLVVAPDHHELREHVSSYRLGRLEFSFVVQLQPLGTANALLAAADFAATEPFLLINSDNYYPRSALEGLRGAAGSAAAAFQPAALRRGNISSERLRNFAVLSADNRGFLSHVVEKPPEHLLTDLSDSFRISMNCWRFSETIFEACRAISLSVRNEFEITDAVNYAVEEFGEQIQLLDIDEPVLDLSTQADVAEVTQRLNEIEVRL